MGFNSKANGSYATAIGGYQSIASGSVSYAFGDTCTASATYSFALGKGVSSVIFGKIAFSGAGNSGATIGLFQGAFLVIQTSTTTNTPTVLTSDAGAASTTNQVILPNNSAFSFSGTIIARQQAAGGSDYAAWEVKGAIIRGANAAATTLGSYNVNVLSKTSGASAWAIALTADTTNGGLAITATGAATTNIRWVATIQTSEVTYA
jgi:hypothetical protein